MGKKDYIHQLECFNNLFYLFQVSSSSTGFLPLARLPSFLELNFLICILGGGALGHPKVYINLVRILVENVFVYLKINAFVCITHFMLC